jgi:uncharacterized protein (DUF1330 family)
MPAYVIVFVEVTDPIQYAEYLKVTPGVIAKYGGKPVVRAGKTETLEGPEEKRRVVVIEFPSMEKAKEWYHSPEYTKARELRQGAANGHLVLVEGVG